jgi:serine/threonine protein kinase
LINCLSLSAIDLIKKLMTVDVKKRITLEEAINHPWFKVSLRITLEEANCYGV